MPLVFSSADNPGAYQQDPDLPGDDPRNVIADTNQRFAGRVLEPRSREEYGVINRPPLTTDEENMRLIGRYDTDESRVLELPREHSSVSCTTFGRVGVTGKGCLRRVES